MVPRRRVSSGGPWEERVGYSRAVRVGDRVWVSGTTGTRSDGSVPEDVADQTRVAMATIAAALREAGAEPAEVVAARIYVTDIEAWEGVAAAVREALGAARPAMTMVQVARLMLPVHRVEIEVEAIAGADA
ncbi:MAG: RidA family protein [Chloroflexi bacterium]|nr:RidA family protein [Chloroflexota bacterium]